MDYWVWMGKYFSNKKTTLPPFESITDDHIEQEAGINAEAVYNNSLYWLPRFYKQPYLSQQFLNEISKFKNI